MKKAKKKISVSGNSESLGNNPFGVLDSLSRGLPEGLSQAIPAKNEKPVQKGKQGRVNLKRVVGGRGGKTVTLIEGEGFMNKNPKQLKDLLLKLKKHCGSGGTLKDKSLEIQGDNREAVAKILEAEGYRVVFAGG